MFHFTAFIEIGSFYVGQSLGGHRQELGLVFLSLDKSILIGRTITGEIQAYKITGSLDFTTVEGDTNISGYCEAMQNDAEGRA